MAKQIAKLLRADISETSNLMEIARMLEKKGRGNDTILAHITKKEAQMLKDAGGSGTVNPDTGLLEFYDGDYQIPEQYSYGSDYAQTRPDRYIDYSAETRPIDSPVRTDMSPPALDYNWQSFNVNQGAGGFGTSPALAGTTAAPVESVAPVEAAPGYFSGLQYGGGVGLQRGGYSELTAAPGQAAALYQPELASVRPGYGITDTAVVPSAAVTQEPTKPAEKSFFDKLSTDQLVRLGLAGGLGLYGTQQAKKAARQAEGRAGEMKAVGAPYQKQGAELQRAAMAGEMTPQSAQAYQAMQARLAQGVEQRGGVGAAQAAAQAEAFRQQLLAQQYNLGLQVSQIGDQIAIGAIRTGMQADQQLGQANNAFYTNLAAIAAGIPMRIT